jgi:hypothetical protein
VTSAVIPIYHFSKHLKLPRLLCGSYPPGDSAK